tara:strand:+ start:359 stop:742 length:384 start_codon:yes stop_codon:yes gene_type:complete
MSGLLFKLFKAFKPTGGVLAPLNKQRLKDIENFKSWMGWGNLHDAVEKTTTHAQVRRVSKEAADRLKKAENIDHDIARIESLGSKMSSKEKLDKLHEISENISKLGGRAKFRNLKKANRRLYSVGSN